MSRRQKPGRCDEKDYERTEKLQQIIDFFDKPSIASTRLASFRALCNGLKACVIQSALKSAPQQAKLKVADLGCGRGGDLRKWTSNRLSYVGLDASRSSIIEALSRYRILVSQGKSNMHASFQCCDLNTESFPLEDACVDIASSMFALQYVFAEERSVHHYLSEVRRVLKPGGIFIAVFPDGNRVAEALASSSEAWVRFGHFALGKFSDTARALESNDPPTGIAYTFSLNSESCAEYVVAPSYLEKVAKAYELSPLNESFFVSGDAFVFGLSSESRREMHAVLKGNSVQWKDWLSLSLFTVFMASREVRG